MLSPLFSLGQADSAVTFVSSMAIILGAIFVVFELRDNKRMLDAANQQAKAAGIQAQVSAEQMKQNNTIADMDIIMRLYEFANTREFQTAWLTVLNSNLKTFEQFQAMPREEQVAFHQVASLFESLGVLVDRGIVSISTVEDMFLPEAAWNVMRPFLDGIPAKQGGEGFTFFEKLKDDIAQRHQARA